MTYVWLGQALLMTVALWGGGTTDDLRSGSGPATSRSTSTGRSGLVGWYLASDLGRAAYHLLTRGLAPTLVGLVLFDIDAARPRRCARSPSRSSLPLAVVGELRDPVPGRQHARSGCSTHRACGC